MKATMKAFLAWANQVSHGPNGKPSSGRVAGLMTVTVLQGVFIRSIFSMIEKGHVAAAVQMFEANAFLAAALLGIAQIGKFGPKPKEPESQQ